MSAEPVVLCIQDGTDLNFATRPGCEGLGVFATDQTGAQTRCLHLHSTLAVTPEDLPLGLPRAHSAAPKGKGATPEEKKSFQWIEGFRDCAELARKLGRGKLLCEMDWEAEMVPLFEEQRTRPEAELLARAKGRRSVAGAASLLNALRAEPA